MCTELEARKMNSSWKRDVAIIILLVVIWAADSIGGVICGALRSKGAPAYVIVGYVSITLVFIGVTTALGLVAKRALPRIICGLVGVYIIVSLIDWLIRFA
jgi:hypothetical protein